MATQAQFLANRHNAQKSTGPRTAEGKATSAKNATKHGLFARKDVVISENRVEFDALREEMLTEMAPVGAMEAILAERIVSLTWRLRRAAQMHDEVIDVKIRAEINRSKAILSKTLITGQPCRLSKNTKRCYDDLALGLIAKWDFQSDRVLERLSMYERRFEASLFKTMGELKKLQDARKLDPSETVETEVSDRGRDARDTGATKKAPDPFFGGCVKKQSQYVPDEEGLSPFKKREYGLLTRVASPPTKANFSHQKVEIAGHKINNGGQNMDNN